MPARAVVCLRKACTVWEHPTAGPTGYGDGEPFPGGGSYLWNTYRGMVAPNVAGLPTRGIGSPAQAVVAAYGAAAGDGSSQRRGPTGWGDGESRLGSGRCLWSAYGGRHSPMWRAHRLSGQGALPKRRQLPMARLRGNCSPQRRGPTG